VEEDPPTLCLGLTRQGERKYVPMMKGNAALAMAQQVAREPAALDVADNHWPVRSAGPAPLAQSGWSRYELDCRAWCPD
jgi:hypothetical protein